MQEIEESIESTDDQTSNCFKSDIPKEEDVEATTIDAKVEEKSTEVEEKAEKTVDESAVNLEVEKQRCREDSDKLFTVSGLEKLLGLLGTILPRDSKVSFGDMVMMTKTDYSSQRCFARMADSNWSSSD